MNKADLHEYQDYSANYIINNPYCGLFLDYGLGKTVSALTAIDVLMNELLEVNKVLVIAPLRVAQDTWPNEIKKWDHLKHLRVSKVLGTQAQRLVALRADADIYIINRENVVWLVGHYGRGFPFDMVVIDELSSFKSPKAQRFKILKMIRPLCRRVVGLTGSPAPNGLIDLWSQIYLLDQGERLGKFVGTYRNDYFRKKTDATGTQTFGYTIRRGAADMIHDKISDICVSMKAEDYLTLPDRIDNYVEINLPDDVMQKYEYFEREQVLRMLDDGEGVITAANAAVLTNKLLQFSSGAVYDEEREVHEMHQVKIAALDELVELSQGQPVLVFYNFIHDSDRIHKHLSKYKPRNLKTVKDIEDWNSGGVPLMLAHPKSAGHGLNLQAGGSVIVWFSPTWSLEEYQQANARLYRQGQVNNVVINHLVIKGTMDERVLLALSGKEGEQAALMTAVSALVAKYK